MTHPLVVTCGHIVELTQHIPDTPRWLGRRARRCGQLAQRLADRLPQIIPVMNASAAELDGYPSTASGADRGGGGRGQASVRVKITDDNGHDVLGEDGKPQYDHVPVTKVEAVFFRRLGKDEHQSNGVKSQADDLIAYIIQAARFTRAATKATGDDTDDFLRLAETALSQAHRIADKHTPLEPAPRCAGTGGSAGATCTNVPDYRIRNDGTISASGTGRCTDCQRVAEQQADTKRKRDERGAA